MYFEPGGAGVPADTVVPGVFEVGSTPPVPPGGFVAIGAIVTGGGMVANSVVTAGSVLFLIVVVVTTAFVLLDVRPHPAKSEAVRPTIKRPEAERDRRRSIFLD